MSDANTGNWYASAASTAAALTGVEVKATPGAGKFLVITQVVFSNEGTANSFVLKDGDATAVYPPTGAVYLGANQTFNSGKLPHPITLPVANKSLTITTAAADHSVTIVHGYVK